LFCHGRREPRGARPSPTRRSPALSGPVTRRRRPPYACRAHGDVYGPSTGTAGPATCPLLRRLQPCPVAVHDVHHPRQELLVAARSEEHTSELQSREKIVCRLLLEK